MDYKNPVIKKETKKDFYVCHNCEINNLKDMCPCLKQDCKAKIEGLLVTRQTMFKKLVLPEENDPKEAKLVYENDSLGG